MADDKKPDAAAAAAVPEGPKKIMGLPLPHLILFAGNLIVLLGGLGYIVQMTIFYKKPAITEEIAVKEITKKTEKTVETGSEFLVENFGEMTINLRTQQGGKNRFATIDTAIVCGSSSCIEQLKDNRAKIEDAIQSSIAAYTYNELGSLDVKFRVKHEILNKINGFLKDTAATDLLFASFTVQ